ncbi:MAG: protein kinase [Chloroflexota bacterium]|nr:protein kinase [Chloroflexota bacterium]
MFNSDLTDQTIKGYHVRELISRGGFGAVYRAYQTPLDRDVAIKVILPIYASQPEFIRRFEVEAHLVARLEHLHIVPLYDYWRDPNGAYLVMRWMRGGSLRQYIKRADLNLTFIVRIVEQITSALNAAHQKNIIHQDIKPDNLLLDADSNAYLADFGIAGEGSLKSDGSGLHGTLSYIAPELFMGEPATPQSDMYSMGVTLFELLTGKHPFTEKGFEFGQFRADVPLLQDFQAGIPDELNTVIQRVMAKNPRERYVDVIQMAADFRRVASRHADLDVMMIASPLSMPLPTSDRYSPVPTHTLQFTPDGGVTTSFETRAIQENPFKGLRPFEEADSLNFFGQERRLEQVIAALSSRTETHFLALVGASGSGKSSLVKAGLIPTLRHGGLPNSQDWFYADFVPGAQPFIELEAALLSVAINAPKDVFAEIKQHEHGLSLALDVILPPNTLLCLFIDQFEEVFTLVPDEDERDLFLRSLARAAQKRQIWIIIALRADFYDRPLNYPLFGNLIQDNTIVILPPNDMEMERAITRPPERVGLILEHGLVEAILEDLQHQPVKLPLLQYALTELFERRAVNRLTLDAYEAFGGVIGSLARRADDLLNALDPAAQRITRQMFLRLVSLGEGMEDTRRRVRREDLLAIPGDRNTKQTVLQTFGQYRLLTFDHDPFSHVPTVEIAHDALIQKWERLHGWIDESRSQLHIQRQLATSVAEWHNAHNDPSYLVRGARLALLESLCQSDVVALTSEEDAYLHACIAARQRGVGRRRAFVTALSVLAVFLFVLTIYAFDQRENAFQERNRADAQARQSQSRELAVNALTTLDTLDRSLLLSLAALNVEDTFEARNSLLTGLQYQPSLLHFLHGAQSPVRNLAVSADGRWIAAGEQDGAVSVWNVEARALAWRTVGHSDTVNAVAFSGASVVSASSDSTIRFWDVTTGDAVGDALTEHQDEVWSIAFSADGQRMASGSEDGALILWDVETRRPLIEPLTTRQGSVWRVAFSPVAPIMASGGADNRVYFWDAETGDAIGEPLEGHTNWIWALAFSPDGRLLASSGVDRTIILWDVETHAMVTQFPTDHTGWVRSLSFNADGTQLISTSADHDIRLWDIQTETLIGTPLTAHQDEVWGAAVDPAGRFFVSGGLDGQVLMWTTVPTGDDYDAPVTAVAVQPDSGTIAVGSDDSTILLRDADTNEESARLTGHSQMILNMAFGTDWLASSETGTSDIFLWNVAAGTAQRLRGHESLVFGLAAHQDLLLSGGEDQRVILWNIADGSHDVLTEAASSVQSVDMTASVAAAGELDGTIQLWRVPEGEPLTELHHLGGVSSVALSADGRWLASGGQDGALQVWDVATGQPLYESVRGHTSKITDLQFQPGNRLLASSSEDGTVRLWDVSTGRMLGQPLRGHDDWVLSLAFSPDGQRLISGGYDGRVIAWETDFAGWQRRACQIANRSFTREERQVYPVAQFSPCE